LEKNHTAIGGWGRHLTPSDYKLREKKYEEEEEVGLFLKRKRRS